MAKTPEQLARIKYTAYLRAQGRAVHVDVGPSRAYLRTLRFAYGMTCRQMAEQCPLAQTTLRDIITGYRDGANGQQVPVKQVFREHAVAIAKIVPVVPKDRGGIRVNATGTARRIQALAALGYPVKWQGEQCGFRSQSFNLVSQGRRAFVYYSTAYKISKLYDRYASDSHPERHGITVKSAKLARAYASRNGYLPPAVWDWETIDDPDAIPDFTGRCGTAQGFRAHYRLHILPVCEPCKHARNTGETLDTAPGSEVL